MNIIEYARCVAGFGVIILIGTSVNILFVDVQMKKNMEMARNLCENSPISCTFTAPEINENITDTNTLSIFSLITFVMDIVCFILLASLCCGCCTSVCRDAEPEYFRHNMRMNELYRANNPVNNVPVNNAAGYQNIPNIREIHHN